MKISIFTPTHDGRHLAETYESIKNQDFDEWVIVPNGNASVPQFRDNRVRIVPAPESATGRIGALKKFACSRCTGDIFLELDHDDLLVDGAVTKVRSEFLNHPSCGFVYSNTAEFTEEFGRAVPYNAAYGWQYRDFEYRGKVLGECISAPPLPSNVSRIWFAPNHLRAWRRDVYELVGGHREELDVLDDQDLMSRTFVVTTMRHIDECLYLYRITGDNTYIKANKKIQDNVYVMYADHILPMAIAWAGKNGLRGIDLGGRFNGNPHLESVDLKDARVKADLNRKWPFENGSVGVIVANDILEHLKNPIHVMKEAHRVLCHGGLLLTSTPSTDGRGAFQDPTHVSFWNENSFWYYTKPDVARYIDTPVRFQGVLVDTVFYSDWHRANNLPYVRAHLLALKEGGKRLHGLDYW